MTDRNHKTDDSSSLQDDESENDPPAQSHVEIFHTEYGEKKTSTEAIILAIAAVEGVEPTELDCLYDSIDPDALDTLMDGPVVIGDGGSIGVEFQYSGYRVSVRNNGSIAILSDEE